MNKDADSGPGLLGDGAQPAALGRQDFVDAVEVLKILDALDGRYPPVTPKLATQNYKINSEVCINDLQLRILSMCQVCPPARLARLSFLGLTAC